MSEQKLNRKDHLSKQKFFTITSTMLMVLFLFQSTQVIRDYVNQYEVNDYVPDITVSSSVVWNDAFVNLTPEVEVLPEEQEGEEQHEPSMVSVPGRKDKQEQILYIGDLSQREFEVVRQWCLLTKRHLFTANTLSAIDGLEHIDAVIVSGSCVYDEKEIAALTAIAGNTKPIVFSTLPDLNLIRENDSLRALMGIKEIKEDLRQCTGLWLFDSFLVGGEALYRPYDEATELRQDFDLTMPFLKLTGGTKTYMVGTLEEENIRGENLPPVIWRNYYNDSSYVFTVNGNYLSDIAGMGILESLMFDKQDYSLYPIVNAQVNYFCGFPVFASENEDAMREFYGRTQKSFATEVLLPEVVASSHQNSFALTCIASTEIDYSDDNAPDEEEYPFIMRQLRSEKAEVGLAFTQVNSKLSIQERIELAESFLKQINTRYVFRAAYAKPDEIDVIAAHPEFETVVSRYDYEHPFLGYLNESTTFQSIMIDALKVSYWDEFRLKCIQTLLGYSSTMVDLTNVIWPRGPEDDWTLFREKMTSNLNSYWKQYRKFDCVSVSKADQLLRNFMLAQVNSARNGNVITLDSNLNTGSLMLRTHGEKIEKITGGEYEVLEENYYLIHVKDYTVEIELSDSVFYQH